jgi:hypothetical protein
MDNEKKESDVVINLPRESIQKPTELDIEYNTCCSKTKSSFLKFVSQLFVSLVVLVYSLTMVALGKNDSVYYSLITLIIGVYIPTPKQD